MITAISLWAVALIPPLALVKTTFQQVETDLSLSFKMAAGDKAVTVSDAASLWEEGKSRRGHGKEDYYPPPAVSVSGAKDTLTCLDQVQPP